MRISKIFLVIFLIGFLLFGFLWVYQKTQYNKKKEAWEREEKVLNQQIVELEKAAELHLATADEWRTKAFDASNRALALEGELASERLAHRRDMQKILELSPDELVTQMRLELGVDDAEVVLTPSGVIFSFAATRNALEKINMYRFAYSTEIPKLEGIIAEKDKANKALDMEVYHLRMTIDDLYMDINTWKRKYQGEHALRLTAENKLDLFNTKDIVVAVVTTVVVGGLVFILK